MNKWQVGTSSAGILIIAVLVATLYSSDYVKILSEHSENVILLDYSQRERAEFLIRSSTNCPYYLLRADPTVLSIKCGAAALVVTDTKVGRFTNKWANLTRNLSSVSIFVDETKGELVRLTDYTYSGKYGGTLKETVSMSQEKIKISYDYQTQSSDLSRVGWVIKKSNGANLDFSDPLFLEKSGNTYWYGGVVGSFKTDPTVILANSNLTYYAWNGSIWFNVTNFSITNYFRFQCRAGQNDCEPTFINKSRGVNDSAGQNASFNRSMFLINNTGGIAVNFVQLKFNDSCSNVNFTVSNQTGGGLKRNLSSGFVNVSGPLLVNATNSTIPIYIFANVSGNVVARAANATGICPQMMLNWEVK